MSRAALSRTLGFALGLAGVALAAWLLVWTGGGGTKIAVSEPEPIVPGASAISGTGGSSPSEGSVSPSAVLTAVPPKAAIRTGLAGVVTDERGVPIAGADVAIEEVQPERSSSPPRPSMRTTVARLRTNDRGRFETTGLDPSLCDVVAEAEGFGWRAIRAVRLAPTHVVEVAIALEPRPEWLGRVIGPSDEPVDGAEVAIDYGLAGGFSPLVKQTLARVSDAGGWFVVPRASDIRFQVLRINARKAGVGGGSLRTDSDADKYEPTVRLSSVREIRCLFTADDPGRWPGGLGFEARGAAGYYFAAKANWEAIGIVPEFPPLREVTIGLVDGPWCLQPFEGPPPRYRAALTVSVPEEGDAEITVPVEYVEPAPVSRMSPIAGGTVEGVVVDAAGHPVQGMIVEALVPVPSGHAGVTDADGRFRLSGVSPAKKCMVGARFEDGASVLSPTFEVDAGVPVSGIRIVVGTRPDLVVQVIGADGGKQGGVMVVLADADGRLDRAPRTKLTDEEGRAEFAVLPWGMVAISVDPASLPPGTQVEDGFKSVCNIRMIGRDPPVMVVQLRKEVLVRGVVLLPDGAPAGAGTATLLGGGPDYRYVHTNARGEFALPVRSLDEYRFCRLSRIVRSAASSQLEREILEPAERATLHPDAENRIVVEKQE